MRLKADIELKLRRFFRKYGKYILVGIAIFFTIVAVDRILKQFNKNRGPETTLTPDVPIMDDTAKVPSKVQKSVEDFIEEYIGYCNDKDYTSAYEMISEDCKNDYFGTFSDYEEYVSRKFARPRKYAIQSYSVFNGKYIYAVKLFDDFLATGLTNSSYRYQEEKIVASYDENKKLVFSVGNFIEKDKIQSVQENDYLKVDVKEKIVLYEVEKYKVKVTNKSDYTIIIQNLEAEDTEIILSLGRDNRQNIDDSSEIILEPGETQYIRPMFSKGYDYGGDAKSLIFTSVRVVDENGEEIDKFSMTMGF